MPAAVFTHLRRASLAAFCLWVGAAAAQLPAGIDLTALQSLSSEDQARAIEAYRANRSAPEASSSATLAQPNTARRRTREMTRPQPATAIPLEASDARNEPRSDSLPLFGYDLFEKDGNVFLPPTDTPAPAEYSIGPGDVIRVQLFGNQNETLNLTVSRDGAINFPKLGPIQLAGLKIEDAKTLIERRVSKELIGVQTNITMGPLRGIQVFLLGDVDSPGAYSVSGLATISHALFAGGGVRPSGSLRDVQLKRAGRVIRHLDLYDLLLKGNSSSDIRVQSGDVIFVPPAGPRVAVAGAVKRPAIYEIKAGLTVGGALSMAGGLTADARRGQLMLERLNADGQRALQALSSNSFNLALRDGDQLQAQSVSGQTDNRVAVIGNVRYPALYAYTPGVKLSAVLAMAQVRPSQAGRELYPLMGAVERTSHTSGLRAWQAFDLLAVTQGRADLVLQAEDRIAVLRRADVEYLTSAPVRAALRGELPGIERKPEASIKPPVAALAAPTTASFLEDMPGKKLASTPVADSPALGVCPGLLDVVKMSDSARALSIRLALNAQESTAGKQNSLQERTTSQQTRAEVECPALFTEAPSLLSYLLEQGVAVIGEARRPGLYPVAKGANFSQVLDVAGGSTAEGDNLELDYLNPRQGTPASVPRFQSITLASLGQARAVQPGEIYQLKPGRALPEVGSVTLSGEVRFPGRYVIARGERLADVIGRAGGLNENAFPYGAVFTRDSTRDAERASNKRAANDLRDALATAATKGSINQNQTQSSTAFLADLVSRLENTEPVGRIVIEADPAALQSNPQVNLLLEPGDSISIPKRPSAVTVTGQVLNPSSLSFVPNARVEDYLKQAGGLAVAADDDRIFLVLPNGVARPVQTSWFAYKSEPIPPGTVIVVPRDAAPLTGLFLTERIASIVSSLALSAAALVTIGR